MAFDVEGARREGYSTTEIVDYLARERQFDAAGARREGHSDDQILSHLEESQRRSGSWLGRRARDAMGTVGGVAGLAELGIPGVGVARSVAPYVQSATGFDITRFLPPSPQQAASATADAAGLGSPQTPEERRNSAMYQGLMGAAAGVAGGLAAGPGSAARAMLVGPSQSALGTAANSVVQLGAGAAGGYASETGRQVVEQAGGGPAAQHLAALAAGLVGGAGTAGAGQLAMAGARTIPATIQPFTESGRRQIVADVLMRSAEHPSQLRQRVEAGIAAPANPAPAGVLDRLLNTMTGEGQPPVEARLPGAVPTTGTAARDPGVLLLEQGLRSRTDNQGGIGQPSSAVMLRRGEAERNALRERELSAMAGNGTREGRGETVRQGMRAADDGFDARVDQLFGIARDRNTNVYSVEPVLNAPRVREALAPFQSENLGAGIPAELQTVIDRLEGARASGINLSQAQNLRSELGEIAGAASAVNNGRLARAAGALGEALENNLNDPRWMQAVAARRQQGLAMGRDESGANAAGTIRGRDQYGAPTRSVSDVMQTALRSPEAARQVLEAGYQGLEAARRARLPVEQLEQMAQNVRETRRALQQQFMTDAMTRARQAGQTVDVSGTMTPVLSPARFDEYIRNNAEMLPVLFEPGQLRMIRRLVNDFSETSLATANANARGSPTMQNMSVGNFLARVSNGLIDPGTVGITATMAKPLRWLLSSQETAINALLTEAVTNPRLASDLLARANPAAINRALQHIETLSSGPHGLLGAFGTAAVRQGVRTATEQEQPQ